MPSDVGAIDLMMGTRAGHAARSQYDYLRRYAKDSGSKDMEFVAEYMFKDVPWSSDARVGDQAEDEPPEGAELLLPAMDQHNVERAMIGVHWKAEAAQACLSGSPRPLLRLVRDQPQQGHGRSAPPRPGP